MPEGPGGGKAAALSGGHYRKYAARNYCVNSKKTQKGPNLDSR